MLELLTNDNMGEADRLTVASGTPGRVLMENAGAAVARAVMARCPPGSNVAIVAGTGNNGGDGFVAARHLNGAGYRVEVSLVGRPENIKGDAAEAVRDWGGSVSSALDLADAAIILDALFGAGLDRPVTGAALEAIGRINAASCPVVAIDL